MSRLRWLVLDDDDPSITYEGAGWYRNTDPFDSRGSSGSVYKGSQHATQQSGSVSFRFNGTRVRLLGSSAVSNSSGTADPAWECFVDGKSIGHEAPFETHQNNWPLCLAPDLLEGGEHILTLNVTVTQGNPFYLDQIRVLPSLDVEQHQPNATVVIEQSDLALSFSDEEDWLASNGSIRSTTTDGASFSMSFTGTKLSFYGWTLSGNHVASSAVFSIDGAAPTSFPIPTPAAPDSGSQFFQNLFETTLLPYGPHDLKVTYQGKGQNPAPLAIDFLLIENGEIVIPGNGTETPVDEPQPSNLSPTPSPASAPSKTPVGAIAGGVAGGVALIALFIFVLLLIRRRMRSNLAPLPLPSFAQFNHRPVEPRYPRQSFSEAMVRKSGSVSRSATTASIISVPNLNYNSTYSMKSNHSRKDSAFMSSDTDLSQSLIPATKLTPLRRNMVAQGATIPE
ncbi:hypothetical protein BKA70DRAFT_1319098 [Coprinopsis sp. MPI-PUGE-AT-0042]|nr:hypothetical protein BKA70DRAFT_1319098 [Coprinopsis sp. MPI-PUGE-AT-0042]